MRQISLVVFKNKISFLSSSPKNHVRFTILPAMAQENLIFGAAELGRCSEDKLVSLRDPCIEYLLHRDYSAVTTISFSEGGDLCWQ